MLFLVFTKSGAVYYGQTSPFWSCLSKQHYFQFNSIIFIYNNSDNNCLKALNTVTLQ